MLFWINMYKNTQRKAWVISLQDMADEFSTQVSLKDLREEYRVRTQQAANGKTKQHKNNMKEGITGKSAYSKANP